MARRSIAILKRIKVFDFKTYYEATVVKIFVV